MDKFGGFHDIPLLEKVTEDIYKLSVHFPFGMRQVNSYLFKGEKGFTIVDTGSLANESIELWEKVLALGIEVEKIVFTHSHPDHIGLAGWFQKNYQIPVYISDLSYKEIQGLRDPTSGKWMHDLFIQHGGPDVAEELMLSEASAYEFEPDEIFGQHERIKLGNDMYQILWTPGHAPDHLCYYQQERQLMVVGDHVLDEISPIIAIWSAEVLNPLQDYFDSLELISGYAVNLALPGHGDLIRNLPARAEAIKLGHLRRMQQICHSIKNEAKTAGQIYQEIYGKLSIYKFFAPLMTTISRLFYLESIGKVRREEKKGIYYYSLTE